MDHLPKHTDPGDQAPEVSPSNHDDGPIVAATYDTHERFEFTPKEEQQREKLDRAHSGFTPVGPYPPQYQYQHSLVEPLPPGSVAPAASEAGQKKKRKAWVGWTVGLVVGILCALGAGIGIGYAIGENVSASSSHSTSGNDTSK